MGRQIDLWDMIKECEDEAEIKVTKTTEAGEASGEEEDKG